MSHFDGFQPLNISTHALREEGDVDGGVLAAVIQLISTHALREEGDWSVRCHHVQLCAISTHALREEGDGSRYSVHSRS